MPFRSQSQKSFMYANHPDIAKRWSKEFPNQGKLPKHVKKNKTKPMIVANNKMKGYASQQGKKIEVNVKKHHGNKTELANSIKHELLHLKHPKAKEKTIQKKAKIATENMSHSDKMKLIAKIRMKKIHRQEGVLKKKFKMAPGEVGPGAYISKINEAKSLSKRKIAIDGMV